MSDLRQRIAETISPHSTAAGLTDAELAECFEIGRSRDAQSLEKLKLILESKRIMDSVAVWCAAMLGVTDSVDEPRKWTRALAPISQIAQQYVVEHFKSLGSKIIEESVAKQADARC